MVQTRYDEFWHPISVNDGGMYIGWSQVITSHLVQHQDRHVNDVTRRVCQIVQWRKINQAEFRIQPHEAQTIANALMLMREFHEGQFRQSWYYNSVSRKYLEGKRPYSTHVEGVAELLAWFFRELGIPRKYFLPAIVVAIFHDGIEDSTQEMQQKIIAFLKENFPMEYPGMIESLFALSHLSDEKYGVSSRIFWLSGLANSRAIETNRTKSNNLARQIHGEVLTFSKELFFQWKLGSLSQHDLPFRAPKDGKLGVYLNRTIWEDWSVANQLNNEFAFNIQRIHLLYRFVIHSYYIWWKKHGMPLLIPSEEDFFRRIEWDLTSMLQVALYSIRQVGWWYWELTLPESIVLAIKIPDQVYNAWDNRYLRFMPPGDKREDRIFKTMILSFRARFYQELLTQSMSGQNSPLHQLMRTVTERLDRVILTPLAASFQSRE